MVTTEIVARTALGSLPSGVFKTIVKIKPAGALQARKQTSGAVTFYWRYSMGTRSERVPIGIYAPSAPPKSLKRFPQGYSLAAAIRAAEELAQQHHERKKTLAVARRCWPRRRKRGEPPKSPSVKRRTTRCSTSWPTTATTWKGLAGGP